MVTEDLSTLMRETAPGRGEPLDLDRVHRLGRRRRRVARFATTATVLGVVAVLGGVWTVLGPGDGSVTVRSAGQDRQVSSLTDYEQRVLRDVPGSYQVDGTVVLTDRIAADAESLVPPGTRIVGDPVPLGFHSMVGPGYLDSDATGRAFEENAPKGSQVVIDAGPVWLGCTSSKDFPGCSAVVLAKDTAGRFQFLYGFGSDDFLEPGAEIELFVDDDYSDRTWHQSLIGGFHGADTARVMVQLTDGSEVEAETDVDDTSPGNTLFWARLPEQVASVRAYDASGKLLAEHALRACTDPVDCEVR